VLDHPAAGLHSWLSLVYLLLLTLAICAILMRE
jgi:hypothetical protein